MGRWIFVYIPITGAILGLIYLVVEILLKRVANQTIKDQIKSLPLTPTEPGGLVHTYQLPLCGTAIATEKEAIVTVFVEESGSGSIGSHTDSEAQSTKCQQYTTGCKCVSGSNDANDANHSSKVIRSTWCAFNTRRH